VEIVEPGEFRILNVPFQIIPSFEPVGVNFLLTLSRTNLQLVVVGYTPNKIYAISLSTNYSVQPPTHLRLCMCVSPMNMTVNEFDRFREICPTYLNNQIPSGLAFHAFWKPSLFAGLLTA
jgi:hypothetical protein